MTYSEALNTEIKLKERVLSLLLQTRYLRLFKGATAPPRAKKEFPSCWKRWNQKIACTVKILSVRFYKNRLLRDLTKSLAGTYWILLQGRECYSVLNLKSLTLLDANKRHRLLGTNLRVQGILASRPASLFNGLGRLRQGTLSFQSQWQSLLLSPGSCTTPKPTGLHQPYS